MTTRNQQIFYFRYFVFWSQLSLSYFYQAHAPTRNKVEIPGHMNNGTGEISSKQEAEKRHNIVLSDFNSSGLTIDTKKSSLEMKKKWLGFIINTYEMLFSVTSTKIKSALESY